MAPRHRDAITAVDSEDPHAIVQLLAAACAEIKRSPHATGRPQDITTDPAIQVMVYELATMCGVLGYTESSTNNYLDMLSACHGAA